MKKAFRLIWVIIALIVLIGGLIFSLKYDGGRNWKVWVIWCAACAALNIFRLIIDFLSKFRGCLGTVLFLILSLALAPLHVVFNIVTNIVAICKKE